MVTASFKAARSREKVLGKDFPQLQKGLDDIARFKYNCFVSAPIFLHEPRKF